MKKQIFDALAFSLILGSTKVYATSPPETVTLSLNDGRIDIHPDGYVVGEGEFTPFQGHYLITGSRQCDTPLDFINNTSDDVTYNVTLEHAELYGGVHDTAIRILSSQAKTTVNIENIGTSVIKSGQNHPGIEGQDDIDINIINKGTLKIGKLASNTYQGYDAFSKNINVTIDGKRYSSPKAYVGTHQCSDFEGVWDYSVDEMSEEEFINNAHCVLFRYICKTCHDEAFWRLYLTPHYAFEEGKHSTQGYYTYTYKGKTYQSPSFTITRAHELNLIERKEPTCFNDGNDSYYQCAICKQCFKDEDAKEEISLEDTIIKAHHTLEKIEKVLPTSSTTGKEEYYRCTTCNQYYEDENGTKEIEDIENYGIKDKLPSIIEGAHSIWTKGSQEGLNIRSNAEFQTFKEVRINGQVVDPSHYQVLKGSTRIIFEPAYLETLPLGTYEIDIVSSTGEAKTESTILAAPVEEINTENLPVKTEAIEIEETKHENIVVTGDQSHTCVMLVICMVSFGCLFILMSKH